MSPSSRVEMTTRKGTSMGKLWHSEEGGDLHCEWEPVGRSQLSSTLMRDQGGRSAIPQPRCLRGTWEFSGAELWGLPGPRQQSF